MKEFWETRYSEENYAYGENPNDFLKENYAKIPKGKVLFPADGEGRNSVFLAKLGYDVSSFDISQEGKIKAENLAKINNTKISYQVGDLETLNFSENNFDALVLIFAHVPSEIRKEFHQNLLKLLKPNGIIIFEAFSKEQLQFNSGGPKQLDMLFSEEEIKNEFPNIKFEILTTEIININEGLYHQGTASVVRFIGIKNEN